MSLGDFLPSEVIGLFENCQIGNHICAFYETENERDLLVSYYIFIGLEKGEMVFYADGNENQSSIKHALRKFSVDVDSAISSGQLTIADKTQVYQLSSGFDKERTTKSWTDMSHLAKEKGFVGLRVAGDVACHDCKGSIVDKIVQYEVGLNNIFPGSNALALCLYHRPSFSEEALSQILCAHPFIIDRKIVCENFDYIAPGKWALSQPIETNFDTLLEENFIKNQHQNQDHRANLV